jgi:UDP-glucose 4-epimerase
MYPDLPMYAAGVYRGEKLEQMIFLWQADMDQYSLYYVNLFKILRDLAQMSMLRAYEYNQAIYEKQYIPHTRLMNAEAFDLALASFNSLREKKVFSYVLLDVDCKGRSYEEADGLLTSLVRVNDMLGASENGHVRILLSQATEDDLQFVLPRFALLDVEVTVIS